MVAIVLVLGPSPWPAPIPIFFVMQAFKATVKPFIETYSLTSVT